MAKQKSKAELLKDIQRERRLLEKTLAQLSHEDMTLGGVVGDWSVKDIMAHLAAWEQLFISWYETGLGGEVPDTKPVVMSSKAIDQLNQQIFTQYQNHSIDSILAKFRDSYRQILSVVEVIPEDVMFTSGIYAWTSKLALADYIAGNTCNHYYWARTKIRDWLKTQSRLHVH